MSLVAEFPLSNAEGLLGMTTKNLLRERALAVATRFQPISESKTRGSTVRIDRATPLGCLYLVMPGFQQVELNLVMTLYVA